MASKDVKPAWVPILQQKVITAHCDKTLQEVVSVLFPD